MIDQIKKCQKCGLCNNQKPLLDCKKECQIVWVGLSAKKIESDDEIPLSVNTNSGMLINSIEMKIGEVSTYKTNLVKCLPLNEDEKLRYPNRKEIDSCIGNLKKEINELSPKIVFLLGEKVYSSVGRHFELEFDKWNEFDYFYKENNGIYYVPIHHPSYVYVYKRKKIDIYIQSIQNLVTNLLEISS